MSFCYIFIQDLTSLTSFKRTTINDVDYSDFLKVFFILILLFSTCYSYLFCLIVPHYFMLYGQL